MPERRPRSRRAFLRSVGRGALGTVGAASLATGSLAATAGCLDGLTESISRGSESGGSTDSPDHDRDAFAAFVADMDSTYGDHGVWGPAADGTVGDLSFVGAWTDHREARGDGFGVVYDLALALFRLDPVADSGQTRAAGWLWCGARPVVTDDGRQPRATALEAGIGLDGGEMGPYDPATDYGPDESPVTIGPPAPDASGPKAQLRIPAGRVRVVPDRTSVGADGGFRVGWAGINQNPLSVAGAFVAQWPADGSLSFTLGTHVEASRGVL